MEDIRLQVVIKRLSSKYNPIYKALAKYIWYLNMVLYKS